MEKRKIVWDNRATKLSHPNKTLSKHIEEVKRKFAEFANFYSLSNVASRAIEYVIEHHDDGKLHPSWSYDRNKSKTPYHSIWSLVYLNENAKIQGREKVMFNSDADLTRLLWFLILKHHSTLTEDIPEDYENIFHNYFKEERFSIKKIVENYVNKSIPKVYQKYGKNFLIELCDAFGLFKLADSLSASENLNFTLHNPEITISNIRALIGEGLTFNETRWNEQLKLMDLPSPLMLRAPTGWGKTTVGFLFFKNKRINKIFYLLPTITAITSFFNKLTKVFGEDNVGEYFYFYDAELIHEKSDTEEFSKHLMYAQNFLKSIMITTLDQFLLSFLQIGRYYTKRVMFRNSGIVIDEIHILNERMLCLLLYFLKAFQKIYNLKILMMSATFPKGLKELIDGELENTCWLDYGHDYGKLKRVEWELRLDKTLHDDIDVIVSEFRKGKKVIVALNTVEEAINLTKILEEKKLKLFDSYTKETPDVLLIHARFMYKHRKKVEEKIDELKVKPHILVTTQVCEVSLDISYDVMFTEIAPISDLIQRFGRVNRYKLKTDEVNVFVYKSKVHPYDDEELEEARKILEEIEELKTERQLIEKLDEVINKNSLYRKLKDASVELNIEKILRDKYFFLSLNVKEDLARGLLELRERITTLVIPNPYPDRCVFAGETEKDRIELANLLDRFSMCDNISERRKIFSEIKSFVVPIPRYWIDATKGFIKEKAGFPLISNLPRDRIYSHRYGFIPLR